MHVFVDVDAFIHVRVDQAPDSENANLDSRCRSRRRFVGVDVGVIVIVDACNENKILVTLPITVYAIRSGSCKKR